MNLYVHYTFGDAECVMLVPKGRGLADVKDGFWINEARQYTQVSDCKYWIPPSKIEYISKNDG